MVAAGKSPQAASSSFDEATNLMRLLSFSPYSPVVGVRPIVLRSGVGIRAENDRVYRVGQSHHACLERRVGGLGKGLPSHEAEPPVVLRGDFVGNPLLDL
jgi:hypothetical protein